MVSGWLLVKSRTCGRSSALMAELQAPPPAR